MTVKFAVACTVFLAKLWGLTRANYTRANQCTQYFFPLHNAQDEAGEQRSAAADGAQSRARAGSAGTHRIRPGGTEADTEEETGTHSL